MFVGTTPLLFDNDGVAATLTLDSGDPVTYSRSRNSAAIGTLTAGQSASIAYPVWVQSQGFSQVHVTAAASASTVGAAPRITKLFVPGNSYAAGQNEVASGTGNRISTVMASLLGATETNIGVGSSALCTDNGSSRANANWPASGGWVSILSNAALKPVRTTATSCLSSQQVIAMLHNGFNDMSVIGQPGGGAPTLGGIFDNVFLPTLRAVIRRFRCGHWGYNWNGTDGGAAGTGIVAYDGSFTKTANTAVTSTGQAVFASAIGATFTLTLPTWYPGGLAVDLMFASSNTNNGTWQIKVDGVNHGVFDSTLAIPTTGASPEHTVTSYRIPGSALAAGARVISAVILTNNGGGQYFDSWSIEAPTPPLVVIDKQPHVPVYPSPSGNLDGTGAVNYNWTAADITALNTRLDAIAAEFTDGRVITVDTDSLGGATSAYFQADNIHPAANFCGAIGGAMATAALNYFAANRSDLAMLGKG